MKVNAINTASYLQNGKLNNTKPQSPNFGGAMYKAGKTMKALALAGLMGMAAVSMSSCKQPTGGDDIGYEIPEEQPTKPNTGDETKPETTPTTPETKPTEDTPSTPEVKPDDQPTTPTTGEDTKTDETGSSTGTTTETPTTGEETQPTTPEVKPSTGEDTPAVEDTTKTGETGKTEETNVIAQFAKSPIQTQMVSMFKTLGLIDSSATGAVESMSYISQSGNNIKYTLDKKNSTNDKFTYNVEMIDVLGEIYTDDTDVATIEKTAEGILKHNSWDDYASLFVDKGDYIQEYEIEDGTNTRRESLKYEKTSSPNEMHVTHPTNSVVNRIYKDVNIVFAE